MRYIALVSVAGLALMAAGPLAMSAFGSADNAAPEASAETAAAAPDTQPAETTASEPAAGAVEVQTPDMPTVVDVSSGPSEAAIAAGTVVDLDRGDSGGGDIGAGAGQSAGGADLLANIIRVSLFQEGGRCPGEQQSLVIIGAATQGWDIDTANSALRIVGNDNDLCPSVSAALERSQDVAEGAIRSSGGGPAPGGPPPGGGGGPGYRQGGG